MNRKLISWTAAAAFALVVVGCSKNQSQSTGEEQPAATSAKKTVDMSTVGSVSGVVKLDGTAPKFKPINMSADPYCVKANSKPAFPDQVVVGDGNTLANVVVYVKTGAEDYSFPTPSDSVTLDQKNCMYTPHVVALMVGQTLSVVNSDDTTHNIHPTPADNREWNKSQPPKAPSITDTFARPEVAIPVKCNVHPWMKSYIAVMANPYYAVTDKDGKFELKNLPPGTYTIEAWQEKYGVVDQTVTIGAKEAKTSDFTFKASSGS
ncbi:MAG TPA: carboxypeptidase regulatory-like domain-containing protein [Candidatus Angelobacter sp.]|nr:carboxypeptidase regulatory-like domain-containing protein [Candidatus Angelobacter sp.]